MTAKYAFIDGEKANYPVTKMCTWMGVSRSGFYDWRTRPVTATAHRREDLTVLVGQLFDSHQQRYGYRRIHADLAGLGVSAGPELVRSIMRAEGLYPVQPRPFRATTIHGDDTGAVPDLLHRDFTAEVVGQKMVGDITYIRTWSGFVYLATVIDCATRMVLGWAIADHMRTDLVTAALDHAAARVTLPADAIFHSDRGTQYTSTQFAAHLKDMGIRASMGRTGVCWDNALAESFFAALKNELIYPGVFPTGRHAERAIGEYIELYYNRRRRHSGLGYRTPLEAYTDLTNQPLPA